MKLALAAVGAALALAPAAEGHQACRSHRCVARVAEHRCSNARPRWCILAVITRRRIREPERSWLLRVPACESSYNPLQVEPSSHATGLYQFLPSTWAGTPWRHRSILLARWQAEAAAWLYEQDHGGQEWVCR